MRLTAFPLVAPPEGWPAGQTRSLMDLLVNLPEKRATVRFYMSLSLLEEGRPRPGAELMRQLINEAPSASVAGLTNFYYQAIADQQVGFEFDPGYIPLDMTAASTDRTAAPPDGSQPGQKPADQTTPPAAADKL